MFRKFAPFNIVVRLDTGVSVRVRFFLRHLDMAKTVQKLAERMTWNGVGSIQGGGDPPKTFVHLGKTPAKNRVSPHQVKSCSLHVCRGVGAPTARPIGRKLGQ